MRNPRRWSLAALALAVLSAACADDTPATTIDFGEGGSTATGAEPTTGATSADGTVTEGPGSATGTGSTTGETDGTATTSGPEALPGRTIMQMVSSGDRSTSQSYQLVFTVGQPSQLQSTHESASYRLRGGLVGANGSPP